MKMMYLGLRVGLLRVTSQAEREGEAYSRLSKKKEHHLVQRKVMKTASKNHQKRKTQIGKKSLE